MRIDRLRGVALLLVLGIVSIVVTGCPPAEPKKSPAPPAKETAAPAAEAKPMPAAEKEKPALPKLPALEPQKSAQKPVLPALEPPKSAEKPAVEKPAAEKPAVEKPAPAAAKPAAIEAKPAAIEAKPAAIEAKPAAIEAKPAEKPKKKRAEKPAAVEAKPAEKPAAESKPAAKVQGTSLEVKVPLGLPTLPIPKDNPMTVEKVELGRQLYFDKRVSKDGTVACATCHDPKMAWAEHEPTSEGIHKQRGERNSPTVINAAYATSQFWDGRAADLEAQAVGPVGNSIEMGHSMEAVVEQFSKIPGYQEQFQKVFGTGVTEKGFAQAVAAFERTILSGDSPYDRFADGDKSALTDDQKKGEKLFEDNCAACHAPPLFSNFRFFNAGIGMDKPKPDEGRKAFTKEDSDLGKFRVPALREVANTQPYFHDGSVAKLEDAVAIMVGGGKDNSNLAPMLKSLRDVKISADDQKKIVEFLKALSGKFPVIEPPKLP